MIFDDEVLNRLTPALSWEPDWADVLGRAGEPERHRLRRLCGKRRLILVFAILVAVLAPLIALSAENEWWFLGGGSLLTPASPPVVVKEGSWDGHPWELVAFRSTMGDLCYGVMPPGSEVSGVGGGLACGRFHGIERPNGTKVTWDVKIAGSSAGGNGRNDFPAYLDGPVIDSASQVEITFPNGQVMRVPTFAAPTSVGRVRFYATQLPANASLDSITSLAGLDKDGHVVACSVGATVAAGPPPLSACK
ncbi:MAG: hypothetical protein ABSC51_11155 [Gaiellaceae bacterium]|jgi:hypothetical protein